MTRSGASWWRRPGGGSGGASGGGAGSSAEGGGNGGKCCAGPEEFTSRAENSFNVRATGGVKFVTGYTPAGRELGVVLNPGSSSWSVLSDRETKEQIVPVDWGRIGPPSWVVNRRPV